MADETQELRDFALTIGDTIAKFVSLQSGLLRTLNAADGVQGALDGFFCQPVPPGLPPPVQPWQMVSRRVQIGFEPSADVHLLVEPKLDHSLSPQPCLNSVTIRYGGQSRYLCLAAWCTWRDVGAAQRYQLGVYGVPNRPVACQAVLRLPEQGGGEQDVELSSFDLRPEERACNPSGQVRLPASLAVDRERLPLLVIRFDTQRDLELRLDYLRIYFA